MNWKLVCLFALTSILSDIIKMQILLNFSLTLTYQRTILIYTHKIHSLILELNPIENNLYFQRKIKSWALNHSKVAPSHIILSYHLTNWYAKKPHKLPTYMLFKSLLILNCYTFRNSWSCYSERALCLYTMSIFLIAAIVPQGSQQQTQCRKN